MKASRKTLQPISTAPQRGGLVGIFRDPNQDSKTPSTYTPSGTLIQIIVPGEPGFSLKLDDDDTFRCISALLVTIAHRLGITYPSDVHGIRLKTNWGQPIDNDEDLDSFRHYAPAKGLFQDLGEAKLVVGAPSGWTWRRGSRGMPARAPTRKSVGVN